MRSDGNNVSAGIQHFNTVTFSVWTQSETTEDEHLEMSQEVNAHDKLSRVALVLVWCPVHVKVLIC